jgi:hypothetical protein
MILKTKSQKYQSMINFVAGIRVYSKKTKLEFDNEVARVERCVEAQYRHGDGNQEFNQFGLNWLEKNLTALLFSEKYNDMYISDVPNNYGDYE